MLKQASPACPEWNETEIFLILTTGFTMGKIQPWHEFRLILAPLVPGAPNLDLLRLIPLPNFVR